MTSSRKRNYDLVCAECESSFKGFRPGDRFCSSACRWRWRDKQPDRKVQKLEINRKWRSWNFDYKRNYMLKYQYGIDQATYEDILATQGGGCAICGKTPEEEGKALAIDHDHKTREIYGILCSSCNRVLVGHIREPSAFRRAADYLSQGTGMFVPEKKKKRKRRRRK